MISIISSRSTPAHLKQLRDWFVSEWGKVDPFEGVDGNRILPAPLLAVDGNQLLGGLAFTYAAVQGTDKIGLWINALFVLPKHRRHGIGSVLVTTAVVEAKGIEAIELFVYSALPDFYQKLGWCVIDDGGTDTVLRKRLVAEEG